MLQACVIILQLAYPPTHPTYSFVSRAYCAALIAAVGFALGVNGEQAGGVLTVWLVRLPFHVIPFNRWKVMTI